MKPSRSSACAVVSNGMRESSHLHLSFAAGSSMGFGAALVVMKYLRARYSSTVKRGSHDWTKRVLPSRYWRAFRPPHIDGQDARRRGHKDGPKHKTQHSKEVDAPNPA